jgi:hypothetical protein
MRRFGAPVRLVAVIFALASAPSLAQQAALPSPESQGLGPLRVVAVLTGRESINETDSRWGVHGTDLGHTFEHDGALYMVFGDTFGENRGDWRSNVAAVITDDDPSDGLSIDRMIENRTEHAGELIGKSMVPGFEVTVIPTYGVSEGDRMFLHFMAVRHWDEPGHWDLNGSGWAYSDDDGQSWTVDQDAMWPGDSNFGQVSIVTVGDVHYIFGIPGGRFGGVQLARVPAGSLLDLTAYDYWDGSTWSSGEPAAARDILPAPVGELSVRWNSHYGKWLMMYLNEDKYAIVLRTADCLTGPWSDERTVATGQEYPQLYAPYIPPRWNDGPEIYFTMSLFRPYNVSLMQTSLTDVERSTAAPECVSASGATPVATQ